MADPALPERSPFDGLYSSLNKESSTDLWDYVVSYSLDRLNPILAQAWPEGSVPALKRKFTIYDEPVQEALDFNVTFSWSQLQFKIERNTAYGIITLNVSGSYSIRRTDVDSKLCDAPRVVKIPPSVRIVLTVPSGSIHGRVIKDASLADTELKTYAEGLFEFWMSDKPHESGQGTVILSFDSSPDANWDLVVSRPGQDIYGFQSHIAPKIQSWLYATNPTLRCSRVYDLEIPGGPAIHDVCLPSSFAVVATGSDADSKGVLSLLVQSTGSGKAPGTHGRKLQGDVSALRVCPLPKDKTVGVLFNRDTFMSKLLTPSLDSASSRSDKKAPEYIGSDSGFKYQLWPAKDQPDTWFDMWKDNVKLAKYHSESSKEHIEPNNTTYDFLWEDVENKASVKYHATSSRSKNFVYDISLDKTINSFTTLSSSFELSFAALSFGATENEDFVMWVPDPPWLTITYDPKKPNEEGWRMTMRDYPPFNFQLPKLDFSPLHRLLSRTLATQISADTATGLRIPFDLLVVGDLASVNIPQPPQPTAITVGIPAEQRFKLVVGDKPAEYFEPFFADTSLLSVFLQTMAREPAWRLKSLANTAKFDFPVQNRDIVGSALGVGASFDHRLVTGTYKFTEPAPVVNWTLFVDTLADVHRIYLNHELVSEVQTRCSDCHISFKYAGQRPILFKLKFTFPLGDINDPISFSGTMSIADDSKQTSPIAGFQVVTTAYAGLMRDTDGFKALTYTAAMLGLLGAVVHVCFAGEQFFGGASGGDIESRPVPQYSRLGRTLSSFDGVCSGLLEKAAAVAKKDPKM